MRKAVVFCLVQIWLQLGDGLKPHLERLSPSQMKLVAIYYEKAARAQLQGMEEQERQGGGSGQAAGDAGPRGGAGR